MEASIPLDKMSVEEKLRALEAVWTDLQRTLDEVLSPSWHGDLLRARHDRVQENQAPFGDWSEAKRMIREHTE